PLPEAERVDVGVVEAEDADAVADPELDDRLQLAPQVRPRLGLEIDRIDVLILLRRVLGVLDAAVGPVAEELGMRLDPGVIGRGLIREIEGDLEAEARRGLD